MKNTRLNVCTILGLSLALSFTVAAMISCGGSSTPTTAKTGTVNVSMTDPLTCGAQLPHIYLTITKVTANISADAGPNDSGWQTLIDLTSSPMQIDLPSLNPTITCVLKTLGSSGPLPPGKYQQIRLYLLSNTASGSGTPSSNACQNNTGWNCVETADNTFHELQLPSEVQTGLKIPSPNIMSGGLTVTAGQSVDLNIDIQSCASIVKEGNGTYRLKPVLFAGEVTPNMNSISGQVVDSASNQAIANATVLFEQATNGTESVMDSTSTDSNGNFFVCPLPGNSYDIVVTAQAGGSSGTTTYNPTVAFSVPVGTNLGKIPLVPETVSTAATGGSATIAGQVDTSSAAEAVTLTPTMSVNSTNVIIPVFTVNGATPTGQPPSVMTAATATPACTVSGANCYNFSLTVPASNPSVGTFSSGSITFGAPASGDIIYSLTASSDGCSGGAVTQAIPSPGVKADTTTTLSSSLSLTGCQ